MARNEFIVRDYNLAATLTSGQAFRWRPVGDAWEGVIHGRWVRLRQISSPPPEASGLRSSSPPGEGLGVGSLGVGCSMLDVGCSSSSSCSTIEATTTAPQTDWRWLTDYLRLDDSLGTLLATFPDDAPMRAAVAHCRGLRLLRQEPWECLASFILSSTKQIVQIQQCIALLSERFGTPVPRGREPTPNPSQEGNCSASASCGAPLLGGVGGGWVHGESWTCFAFPTADRLAAASEAELRDCKIGFRAAYLLDAARRVSSGQLDLAALPHLPLEQARAALMECHGVGRKIADCVLLFALGFDEAFPIDVWVERALRQLYFPRRRVKRARLERFAATHFGPHAGLAQQYLFHYLRTNPSRRN